MSSRVPEFPRLLGLLLVQQRPLEGVLPTDSLVNLPDLIRRKESLMSQRGRRGRISVFRPLSWKSQKDVEDLRVSDAQPSRSTSRIDLQRRTTRKQLTSLSHKRRIDREVVYWWRRRSI
jgi:hypothetical protein